MTDGLIAYAEEKQPIILGCGALPGATSPISIMGTMVTATAELLSGIVLVQLLCPGLPCVYGNMAAGTDLRFAIPSCGTPETGKFIALSKALCEYYNIPCRGGGSLTDAKQTDFEAGAESMMTIFSSLAAGLDYVIHAVGIMDSYNVIGYEKFILDEQNIEMVNRLLQDYNTADDVLGYDTICEVPHGGQFITMKHTLRHMHKESYIPAISTRGHYGNWVNGGSKTILDKANEAIDKRLSEYKEPVLRDEARTLLDSYLPL
jgi:trimethylamine--corrinoid protein Co-methyltransferase